MTIMLIGEIIKTQGLLILALMQKKLIRVIAKRSKHMNNEKKYSKKCEVCQKTIDVDIYKQGKCPYCGWWNCFLNEENPDIIAMPNLISLNKAKKLYSEGKSFEPDLDEFIEALHGYSEMQFEYNGVYYAVELVFDDNSEQKIRLYNSQTKETTFFNNDEDFKNNAKVDGKLLKDVWNATTDRYWLQ